MKFRFIVFYALILLAEHLCWIGRKCVYLTYLKLSVKFKVYLKEGPFNLNNQNIAVFIIIYMHDKITAI